MAGVTTGISQHTESKRCTVEVVAEGVKTDKHKSNFRFLPERDYMTFGSLLLQICLSSVTLVHPTQRLNVSAIFFHRCVRWPSSDLRAKFYADRPSGTPPSGALKARGVAK